MAQLRRGTSPSSARAALTVACGGTFLGFRDATVTNLALPEIGADYSVGVTTLGWVVTAYAIPLAALLAPAGAIADAFGLRPMRAPLREAVRACVAAGVRDPLEGTPTAP